MTSASSPARTGGRDSARRPAHPESDAGPAAPTGYREYVPAPALQRFVECFWSSTPTIGGVGGTSRILPDGCVDIVLEYDGALEAAAVVGTMTRPLITAASARSRFVGVRFRPGAAHTVFGVPAAHLTDRSAPLAELWSDAEAALDEVRRAADVTQRVRTVQQMLMRRLATRPAPPAGVDAAVRMIARARGNLAIAALGPALGMTRQHLARCFARDVGVSPKMFARVARVRAVVDALRQATCAAVDWSRVALDAGYYDQAHLVHDVRALTGLTPGEWVAER